MKPEVGKWVIDTINNKRVRVELNFVEDSWIVYDPDEDLNYLIFEDDIEIIGD